MKCNELKQLPNILSKFPNYIENGLLMKFYLKTFKRKCQNDLISSFKINNFSKKKLIFYSLQAILFDLSGCFCYYIGVWFIFHSSFCGNIQDYFLLYILLGVYFHYIFSYNFLQEMNENVDYANDKMKCYQEFRL